MGCTTSSDMHQPLGYKTDSRLSPYLAKRVGNHMIRIAVVLNITPNEKLEISYMNEYSENTNIVPMSRYKSSEALYRGMKVRVYSNVFCDIVEKVEPVKVMISYGQVIRDSIDIIKIRQIGNSKHDEIEVSKRALYVPDLAIYSYVKIGYYDSYIIDVRKITEEEALNLSNSPLVHFKQQEKPNKITEDYDLKKDLVVLDLSPQDLSQNPSDSLSSCKSPISDQEKPIPDVYQLFKEVQETTEIEISESEVLNGMPIEVSKSPETPPPFLGSGSSPEFLTVSFAPGEFIKYEDSASSYI